MRFFCEKCDRTITTLLKKKVKCKICEVEMLEIDDIPKPIKVNKNNSKKEIGGGWKPSLGGGTSDNTEGRFVIGGKVVQGNQY